VSSAESWKYLRQPVTLRQACLSGRGSSLQRHQAYRGGHYNETQVRQEFVNPLFKYLGRDMDNDHGYAEACKDLIHEDGIKIGGANIAPDYCFRIGGARKFFLEAKQAPVNLKDDPAPTYQLRRYAWSAKLPLSILTSFAVEYGPRALFRPRSTRIACPHLS
jgi:hypothetical protein